MNTESNQFPASIELFSPLAVLLDTKIVSQAHARMSSRVPCTVYRPLDRPRLARSESLATADFDMKIDGSDDDAANAVEEVDWLDGLLRKLPQPEK